MVSRDLRKHRKIQIELRKKKLGQAKKMLKVGEKLIIHTNRNMETHAFAKNKSGDLRTLKYLGHTNEEGRVSER